MQNSSPNFFLVIPSHILDDPNIDDSEAILFGRIVSLSNAKGFCFASDKYLAELCRVSPNEINKRLLVLEQHGYIRRETKKDGLKWDRKIYPNFNYESPKRSTRVTQTEDFESSKRSEEQDKYYKYKNTTTRPSVDSVVVSFFDQLNLSEPFKEKVLREYPPDEIENAVKRCLKWKSRPNDEIGLMTALKKAEDWKDTLSKDEQMAENRRWLNDHRRLDGKVVRGYNVCVGTTYIEFNAGPAIKVFKIDDPNFIDTVETFLQKTSSND